MRGVLLDGRGVNHMTEADQEGGDMIDEWQKWLRVGQTADLMIGLWQPRYKPLPAQAAWLIKGRNLMTLSEFLQWLTPETVAKISVDVIQAMHDPESGVEIEDGIKIMRLVLEHQYMYMTDDENDRYDKEMERWNE